MSAAAVHTIVEKIKTHALYTCDRLKNIKNTFQQEFANMYDKVY